MTNSLPDYERWWNDQEVTYKKWLKDNAQMRLFYLHDREKEFCRLMKAIQTSIEKSKKPKTSSRGKKKK